MIVYQDGQRVVHRLLLNSIQTNCYILARGDEALLIDPTDQPEAILDYLDSQGLVLRHMLATHGHCDHVSAAAGLIASGRVDRLQLHADDLPELKRAMAYSVVVFRRKMALPAAAPCGPDLAAWLARSGLVFEHAGGHTPGSSVLYSTDRQLLITGDLALHHRLKITLANAREDLPAFARFLHRVQDLFTADTVLLPGHGEPSTVGQEWAHNAKWAYVRAQADALAGAAQGDRPTLTA